MALVNIREPIPYPARWSTADGLYASGGGSVLSAIANTTLSAAGDVLYFVGRIQWDDGGSHTVARIWFRTGAVTNVNGVDLRVGFQTVSGINPRYGDGVFDSSGDLNSPISSNTTYGVAITGGPTLADGTEICVAIDALNDSTPDSIAICTHNCGPTVQSAGVIKNSSKYVRLPSVVFESTDGTPHYGTFVSSQLWVETLTVGNLYNSGTTYDEYGIQFRVPFSAKTKEIYWYGRAASGASLSARLYKVGTPTQLAAAACETYLQMDTALSGVSILPLGSEVTLEAGADYIASIKALNTTNVYYTAIGAGTAISATGAHTSALPGGTNAKLVYRSGTGSWIAEQPNNWPFAGVLLSALDDGAGGSVSGMIVHPGMSGGMRG